MNATTLDLLHDMATLGHAIVIETRTRQLHAALDLIKQGLCYRANTYVGCFSIKFGRNPEAGLTWSPVQG